jgi:ATP-binding protein involved in chromosome partitioning
MLTTEEVMQAMAKAAHPEIDCSLVELGMIKHVTAEQEKVVVTMNLPFPRVPVKDELVRIVTEAVANEDHTSQVEVQFATMNEEEREEFMKKAREKWRS